jgi:hypothetical protein
LGLQAKSLRDYIVPHSRVGFSPGDEEVIMRYDQQKHALNVLVFSVVLSAFLFLFTPTLWAQQTRSPAEAAMERQRQRQIRQNERIESNLMISTLEKEAKRPVEEKHSNLAYMQIKEDFERIQTIHNKMMEMTFSNNVLDYKRISETSTEIQKRASRLMSNLPLPDAEVSEQDKQAQKSLTETELGQVKPALLALDSLMMSFVSNPIFQSAQVVDVQQASKAKRDLEAIIKLSGKIKKSAARLNKTTARQS